MKTEQQTRVELIDKQLARAGWNINDPTQVVQEYDILVDLPEGIAEAQAPYQGHQFSDYVLLGKNGKPLTRELINTDIAGRDYQIRAIRSVLEGIEQKKRSFLLVMATGTGKTRISIALVDALMRAGYMERVLFLVDRIALREQALSAFKEYLPNEPRWPNVGEKLISKDRRIYVSTYPFMLNIIREDIQRLSPHSFDLILIDESHRSIYNTYGEVLDYFKTINLGLTATPTEIIDHNTFRLFDCEDGLPSYAYTFEEAVKNTPPYPQYKGELVKVLVSDDPRVYGKGGLLDQFNHNDMPRIAISVDMLDIGIDIQEIVNLVFAKPVYSYTKFWQMIGRNTRLLESSKIKPWCVEKDCFLIMDCWDNFEYFKLQPEGKTILPKLPLPIKLFGLRLDKIETALGLNRSEIADKEIGKLKKLIEILPLSSVVIKEAAKYLYRLKDDNFWNYLDTEKLAPLMKFREKDQEGAGPVLLDLKDKVKDKVKNKEMVEFGPQNEAISISRYKEMVEKRDLIQSPFTVIHPLGIRGVFSPGEINEILTLTEHLAA